MTMPATTEKRSNTAADYKAFIASLQLYTIGLAESSCEINREAYWEEGQEQSISYKLTSKPLQSDHGHFDVRSALTLNVSREKSKPPVIRVAVAFDLHFHAESLTKEFVEKFCESEIQLIVWPYFREYVTNITARMHIPPVILPLSNKSE